MDVIMNEFVKKTMWLLCVFAGSSFHESVAMQQQQRNWSPNDTKWFAIGTVGVIAAWVGTGYLIDVRKAALVKRQEELVKRQEDLVKAQEELVKRQEDAKRARLDEREKKKNKQASDLDTREAAIATEEGDVSRGKLEFERQLKDNGKQPENNDEQLKEKQKLSGGFKARRDAIAVVVSALEEGPRKVLLYQEEVANRKARLQEAFCQLGQIKLQEKHSLCRTCIDSQS
jgi:hypothetical protein